MEINIMAPTYTAQPDLQVRKTNVGTQKIDRLSVETYSIVIAIFQVLDKLGHSHLF